MGHSWKGLVLPSHAPKADYLIHTVPLQIQPSQRKNTINTPSNWVAEIEWHRYLISSTVIYPSNLMRDIWFDSRFDLCSILPHFSRVAPYMQCFERGKYTIESRKENTILSMVLIKKSTRCLRWVRSEPIILYGRTVLHCSLTVRMTGRWINGFAGRRYVSATRQNCSWEIFSEYVLPAW